MRISWKWLGPGIAVVAVLAALGAGWWWLNQFQDAATAGKRAAGAAVSALTDFDLAKADQQFETAEREFGRARDLLGPDWLTGIPGAGPQFSAAAQLTEIGATASSAGSKLTGLLTEVTASGTQNRFGALAKLSDSHLEPALGELTQLGRQSAQLSSEGLVGPLADAVTELKGLVGKYQPLIDTAAPAQELVHYLFSSQRRFILLSQNSAELRPVGGFPGTYGLVRTGPDGFTLEKYEGVYRLPKDTLNLPAPEGARMSKRFKFHNANWWIDLPTSAPVMLKFWENIDQPEVDGFIMIDVITLRELLTVFGPVTLPGTTEQLTRENAVRRLTEFIEFDRSSYGKVAKAEALVPMIESMLKNLETVDKAQLKPLLSVLGDLVSEKHIQLYSIEQRAQAAITELGIGGAIAPPEGTTDLLVASNAVVCTTKTNLGVSKSLNYAVSLKPDGSATSNLKLGFVKTSELYEGLHIQYFCDYLRVYRTPGTTFTDPATTGGFADRPEDGRPVFGKDFELQPGDRVTHDLDTTIAKAMTIDADQQRAHYRLLMVRQADLTETAFTLRVIAPEGWRFSSGAATWRPGGGEPVTVQVEDSTAALSTDLHRDLIVDLELTRA